MRSLAEIQSGVRNAVATGDFTAISPLLVGGQVPEHRLAIYRRHYEASLITALFDKFPATTWLLPWVFAIARRVRVDHFRERHRLASHEIEGHVLPKPPLKRDDADELPTFDDLVAPLPESQREVLTMLKVNGLSIEDVARATYGQSHGPRMFRPISGSQ